MMKGLSPTQASKLQDYLVDSNQFYLDLLGYKSEKTSLEIMEFNQWNFFHQKNGTDKNLPGIYLPRNQTAIIPEGDSLSLFHEYFGHGLYCEQSLSGKKLVNLEKKLLEEEKQEFKGKQFTLKDLKRFRKQNKTAQELQNLKTNNLGVYESFAIFSEYILSEEFNMKDLFERKYDSMSKENKEAINSIINFSEQYGDLATFYEFGLGKVQDEERLLKLSKDIFNNKLDETDLILHFGSGKPFSDIDLFIVSDKIEPSYCDWLDIRAYNPKDAEEKIRILDSRVTDPIIVGSLIFGDEKYLSELKRKILIQPITDEAVRHNLEMAEYSEKRSLDASLGKTLQTKNLRSSKTYLTNALALENGNKFLTFNELTKYSHVLLQNEKFIELKGGIIE